MNVKKKGIAVVELMFMLLICVMVVVVLYGGWGAIHTGILNSIAARTYTTLLINNRSNLLFVHEWSDEDQVLNHNYYEHNTRFFATIDGSKADSNNPKFISVRRTLDLGESWSEVSEGFIGLDFSKKDSDTWKDVRTLGLVVPNKRNENLSTAVIKLKQGYGICMNSHC